MNTSSYLTNHFLIAMPALQDPNFAQSVTYICEHNEQGAMGIVINHLSDISMAEVFEQLNLHCDDERLTMSSVFAGGPVERERGFVLHEPVGNWEATLAITDSLALTSSLDILRAMAENKGPSRALVALGYAGWGAGQLEQEMINNAWLSGPANTNVIFELPVAKRWYAAAESLGVDLNKLSTDVGHA